MPDLIDRINLLGKIIQRMGGEIDSRKRVQKLIYILQEMGVIQKIYEFKWGYYGVYSSEAALDIQQGQTFGLFKEEKIENAQFPQYAIRIDNVGGWNLDDPALQANQKMQIINEINTPLLEVVSSILYFKEKGYNDAKIRELLKIYKGHLKDLFNDGFQKIRELNTP